MNCHMRMSPIVLVLLWTLCTSGTGSRNKDGNDNATSNIIVNTTSLPSNYQFINRVTNQLQLTATPPNPSTTITTLREGTKTGSRRSKLWSPYSTLVGLMDENEDDVRVGTTTSTFSFEKSISRIKSKSGNDEAQVTNDEEVGDTPPKLPLISSIRHYRSRKTFVRSRKTLDHKNLQSDITTKSSHVDVKDLEDGEQGDQPFIHASSDAKHASETSNRHQTNFGKLVEEKAPHNGQSGGISLKTGTERVYGIPYLISAPTTEENTSTKLQKMDKFLLRKHAITPSSNTSKNSNSSHSGVFPDSQQNSESYLRSTDVKYGVAILQPTLDNKFQVKDVGGGESTSADSRKERRQQNISLQPTRKPKGGGKRSREKNGTKRPQYADENNAPDGFDVVSGKISSFPTSPFPDQRESDRKKVGVDSQQGAFRKVKEKTKNTSRLPDIHDKSVYKSENAHSSNDNDHDGDGGTFQTADHSRRGWEGYNGGLEGEVVYFPKILEEEGPHKGAGENDESLEIANPDTDLYESFDGISTTISDNPTQKEKPRSDVVTVFLRIVESQHTLGANCTRGTDFNLGDGVVDRYAQERFRLESELTVNRANMLTRIWKYSEPKTLEDEYLLHAMVISLIEFDEDIFAAGNCYDENQYKNYTLFCPYGYREQDGSILVKDLSLEYPYLSNTSEWFYQARKDADRIIKNFNRFSRGSHSFRRNESNLVEEEILNVTYDDGKWSKPYFDCGGGNIWMITYTIPFFGYNGTYYFKGTSGIDIDLRRVDIDQCPLPANSTELNIFAASDKCKKATTKCVPIKGLGFRRGSYRCYCSDGFYFPNVSSPFKYFNGTLLEEEYEKKFTGVWNETSVYDTEGLFECLPCPFGCDTCVDDRPCVVSLNWLMRSAILILQSAIIAMLPIVGLFTWKYSNVKVVRAASPVLLRFIILGAFFIYCTILVMYPSPNIITCTIRVWLREIGFSLAYGGLLLKTWRISVIFRVRSAKAIKITDLDLMKRMGAIVGTFTSLLVIRTLVAPPVAIVSYTADELKAWLCKSDWWDHSFTIMELCFLVWGIRLCIVVRKAPSEFNESKFISLAIYNEFLLSIFLNISMLFLQSPANPDLLYIIFFCHVQLTMTLLLCLIFGSKAYIVFRGQGKEGSDETRVPTSKFISKSRSGQTTKQTSAHNSTGLPSSTTSTSHDPNLNARLSEDVQEEFRRLYFQLEELKERNMRLGNRHLVAKITAMQEAADNILCTSAQINGQQTGPGTSPNVKGKSGVLSDISEEENTSQPQSTVQTPKPEATGILEVDKTGFNSKNLHRSTTNTTSIDSLKDGQQCADEGDGNLPKQSKIGDGKEHGSKGKKERDRVQFKNLELQDTNLDEVESDGDEEGVDNVGDIKPDCINDKDTIESCESIPMQSLRKRKHKQQQSSSNPSESVTRLNSSTEIGKQHKSGGEKSQNHTAGSNVKLVLDLDDKSRFTEEITV